MATWAGVQCDEVLDFSEGLARIRKGSKWGIINNSGQLVVQCQWDHIGLLKEGLAWVVKNKKCGFINEVGQLVVPIQWDEVRYFFNGLAKVKKNGQWGKINTVGQLVIPPLFNQDFNKVELLGKERNYKWEGDGLTIKIGRKFKLIFNKNDELCWLTNSTKSKIILEADTFETNLGLMKFLEIE